MSLLRKARKLEEGIARALDGAARTAMRSGPAEPLEIVHAICEAAVAEVQAAGRGKQVFPFNRIKVSLAAPSNETRARVAAVLDSEPSLTARIAECLHSAGCETRDLVVKTVYVPAAQADWTNPQWHVEFAHVSSTDAASEPASASGLRHIELTIVSGVASPQSSSLFQTRIDLGRCVEVRDGRNRLIRTNHVAFADDEERVNQSVSRRHAHIELSAHSGEYRVHDDHSAQGTHVLRDGRVIAVPVGGRGIRLRSGDEIVLGEARVMVTLAEPVE